MSNTAYMIIVAFMSIYIGILLGLHMGETDPTRSVKPVPQLKPIPLATPPSVKTITKSI